MNGNIRQLNEDHALHQRARAYCQNNPGVGFADAVAHLVKADPKTTPAREVRKNKE